MSDVSRETPSWPEMAERVFPSDRLVLAATYADLLRTEGVLRGLIGPREVPRLWERHLVNCALMAELVPLGAALCDVGSGAGLPGLVLAIARPDLTITLVEPLLRRTTFLQEAVDGLSLECVTVLRGRAESMQGATFDVVTSRAVAPLERLLHWSMPLVAPQGVVLAMKGSGAQAEVAAARPAWQRLGCAEPEVVVVGGDGAVGTTTLVRVAWADPGQVSSDLARRSRAAGSRRPRRTGRRPSS